MLSNFIPLFIMMVMATGLALTLLLAANIIGPRRANEIKTSPYESGMDPAWGRRRIPRAQERIPRASAGREVNPKTGEPRFFDPARWRAGRRRFAASPREFD
ncbi:MAG: hypothetical protein BRD38_00745 [Bacteroidetes bacterium QH_9_67_14]|nr:MAG: hypothetical protein BRD38_00745 [Bacteroidetes bacterium QH_9_67_14]